MPAHDVMPDMELFQPVQVEDALSLAARYADRGWLLGGGQDTYGWLKDRAKRAEVLIDLNGIEALRGIRQVGDSVEIGALTTLTEIEQSELLKERYSLLSDSARVVASPQIRNAATLGGNLNQDVRCWYYRRGLHCYRAGGNICYADTPDAMNREHALFNASRCVAVTPSDIGPALVALEAEMVVAREGGRERTISAEDYFVGPNVNIEETTALRQGEIMTAVRIPAKWAGARFYYEKVADRNVWDFALVSIASAVREENGSIAESRFVCGAVECKPRRLQNVERAVRGRSLGEDAANAAQGLASQGARPLNYNHFKMPLMDNLVKRALS